MSASDYTPASVLDIVTFGFRQAFKHWRPLLQLMFPGVLLMAVGYGLMPLALGTVSPQVEDFQTANLPLVFFGGGLGFIGLLLYLYSAYAVLRFIRDSYFGALQPNLWAYWLPASTLVGLMGLGVLSMLLGIPMLIGIVIGFMLLVLPGIILASFCYVLQAMFSVVYMAEPEKGVMAAFKATLGLCKGNVLRFVGVGLLGYLVQAVLGLPMMLPQLFLGLLSGLMPSFTTTLPFALLYGGFHFLSMCVEFVVGVGGMLFVLFGFYFDLRARKEGTGFLQEIAG